MIETELLRLARANDPEARRTLVAELGLGAARAVLGEPKSRADGLRALVRESGAAPALAYYLAAIAEDATDTEVRRASELVRRVSVDRWGPPEREAIGRFVGDAAPALGAEECVEQVEFLAQYPDGDALRDACEGAWDALADVSLEADEHQRFQWQPGFQVLLARLRAPAPSCALTWTSRPAAARNVARALFSAQARERGSVMPALDALWSAAPRQEIWADALAEAASQNRGMAGRDEFVGWSWARFCARPGERALVYRAFRPWRDLWIELRNAMPREVRPGGESAVAHLLLWGSLDLEKLSETVDEAVRLATPADWVGLVDAAMDLATAAPREAQLHALAGACRMSFEIRNREEQLEAAATRYLERADALTSSLRARGILDPWIGNRVTDLEDSARMIREGRERRAHHARELAEREQRREQQRLETEARIAEAKAQAEEAKARALAQQALIQAQLAAVRAPHPTDHEVFFPSLPIRSVYAYARMFKLLQQPHGMQSLATEGVSPDMLGAITTAWSSLFAMRPELAQRFSALLQEIQL